MEFHDRRPNGHYPTEDDYTTPLSPRALTEANRRLVSSQPAYRAPDEKKRTRQANVQRHRARQRGTLGYDNIGGYLALMTGAGGAHGNK